MVRRHHLHPDRGGLALPGHRHRHRLPPRSRLGHRRPPADRTGRRRAAARLPQPPPDRRGRVPLGSRLPGSTPAENSPMPPASSVSVCRSAAQASAGTTRSPSPSSPPSSAKCSAIGPGPAGQPPTPRSLSGLKAVTTCGGCTAALVTAIPPGTKPSSRPDHHADGVRQSGTSSSRPGWWPTRSRHQYAAIRRSHEWPPRLRGDRGVIGRSARGHRFAIAVAFRQTVRSQIQPRSTAMRAAS